MAELTAARLREVLNYDSETGVFTRRTRTSNATKVGDVAGSYTRKGYLMVGVDHGSYQAHRLAWLYVFGSWPDGELDHADGNRGNNSIGNLRRASRKENCFNQGKRKHNTSGFKGVSWHHGLGKWRARIAAHGGRLHLGYYDTAEDAGRAYETAATKFHGAFAKAG